MTTSISANTSVVFGPSSYTIDGGSAISFNYTTACQITNSGSQTLVVSFQSGITISNSAFFLQPMSNNITFDGQYNEISVNISYGGLIQSTTLTNIIIQNIGITGTSSSLASGAGYILGVSCRNATINNCYVTCNISLASGSGRPGGIAGQGLRSVTINNCYTTGTIGNNCGGIIGGDAGATISNCYSLGTIGSNSAGIYANVSVNSGTTIRNCYSFGTISSGSAGIAPTNSQTSFTNCYAANGTWNDASANAELTGCPANTFSPGTTWTSVGTNTPYLLSLFNTLQTYNPNTVAVSSTQGSSYTSSNGLFNSPFTYRLQNVNNSDPAASSTTINGNTGAITFQNLNYVNPSPTLNTIVFTALGSSPAFRNYNFGTFSLIVTPTSNSQIYANNDIVISNTTYTVDGGPPQLLGAFPIAINQNNGQSGNLNVKFTSGITYTNINNFFIPGTPNITFNGKGNQININVQSYPGLIQNGTSTTNGENNIKVQNIGITTSGSGGTIGSIPNAQGSIAQEFFANNARNNIIQNCFSTIGFSSGTSNAGLICGRNAGNGGSGATMLQINNCYSTSQIITVNSQGGICGFNANAIISNCYNTSTGNDLGNSGAICSNSTSSNLSISNCYCLSGQLTGPISIIPRNCYNASINGGWSNSDANFALIGIPQYNGYIQGSVWTTPNPSSTTQPYLLSSFNIQQIYNPIEQIIKSTQGPDYTLPSNYVNPIYSSGYNFSLIGVNNAAPTNVSINATTGILSYTNLEYSNTTDYNSLVVTYQGSGNSYFGYTIDNFDLITQPILSPISANNSIVITSTTYTVDGGTPQTLPPFPISIINNNPSAESLIVSFSGPITYTSIDNYFVCDSGNITFDGQINTININVVDNWLGLINSNSQNNIIIQNLIINAFGYSLTTYGSGWLGWQLFNGTIINCGSIYNLLINNKSGGIVGSKSSGSIQDCYAIGDILNLSCGIAGYKSTNLIITNCYSISTTATSTTATGIAVNYPDDFDINITNCYCLYGEILNSTNCYTPNGNWNDSDANNVLIGTPIVPLTIGSMWASVGRNTPYLLSSFNTVQTYNPNAVSIPAEYGSSFTTGPGSFTGGYKYYLLTANGPANSSIGINQSNGKITFTNYYLTQPHNESYNVTMFSSLVVGDPIYYGYNFSNFDLTLLYIPEPISHICFPADTPIKTDRGIIPIQKINLLKHTINYKKIVAITKTVSTDEYLICFEKNSLKHNVPSERTLMSKDHKILFNNKLTPAEEFLNIITNKKSMLNLTANIYKVKYDGEPLYNVLMEDYDTMSVNNIICETLHPNNLIARLYNSNLGEEFKQKMIIQMNEAVKNENQESYEQAAVKLHTVSFLKRRLCKKM